MSKPSIIHLKNIGSTEMIYPANVVFQTKTSINRMAEKHITFVADYFRIGVKNLEYVLNIGINLFAGTFYGALEFRVIDNEIILDHITPIGKDKQYFIKKYKLQTINDEFYENYAHYDDDFKTLYRNSLN